MNQSQRTTQLCARLNLAVAYCLAAIQIQACCGVSRSGKPVAFGDQTNIVIWNAATQTEHFIRNAKFQSNAENFGFIAPSPSKPDLSEASSEAFDTLAELKPVVRPSGDEETAASMETKSLRVVQEEDVAGYHATTLLAADPGELAKWMRENNYNSTPAVEAWSKPYIQKGWYLTAFKVISESRFASTGTVRMSFKSSKPFNPFFVPADNIASGPKGTLKVYFVSNGDYDAQIGGSTPWQEALWRAPISGSVAEKLAAQLKLPTSEIPTGAQVEAFQDNQFPRVAADDIYFTKGHGSYALAVMLVAMGGAAVWFLFWRSAHSRDRAVNRAALTGGLGK